MRRTLAVVALLPLVAGGLLATPAYADGVVKRAKLESSIEKGFAKQGYTVDAQCPKSVSWVKGKVFYCKVMDGGSMGRVKVTLRSGVGKGHLTWKLV